MGAELNHIVRCRDRQVSAAFLGRILGLLLAAAGLTGPAVAQRAGGAVKAARADFADMAAGSYLGEVVPGEGGAPRSAVRLTVAKTGPNQVRVTSEPPRLPAFTARLGRTLDRLHNIGGDAVFLLDLSRKPRALTVTVGKVTWAGVKQQEGPELAPRPVGSLR